jgi:hypothetical protein
MGLKHFLDGLVDFKKLNFHAGYTVRLSHIHTETASVNAGTVVQILEIHRFTVIEGIGITVKHGTSLGASCGVNRLIEECITGSEIELAVLEENGIYTVSAPAEIDVGSSEFYDYDTKYVSDASSFYIPARLSDEETAMAKEYALTVFKTLDCKGLSRVDFFYTKDKKIVFNEINTIPGFTPISMYPRLMIHGGISYSELISRLINGDLKACTHRQRKG